VALAELPQQMKAMEVVQLIEEAWRDVPFPGMKNIFTPDSYDDEDIVRYFGNTTWRGHDPANLRAHSSAFTFFTPEAFHYWFPAFLIAAIQNPEEADVIVQYIPWSLYDKKSARRWRLFTDSQKRAVVSYLRYQVELFPEEASYERKALQAIGETV
jgi:hypothetical protein